MPRPLQHKHTNQTQPSDQARWRPRRTRAQNQQWPASSELAKEAPTETKAKLNKLPPASQLLTRSLAHSLTCSLAPNQPKHTTQTNTHHITTQQNWYINTRSCTTPPIHPFVLIALARGLANWLAAIITISQNAARLATGRHLSTGALAAVQHNANYCENLKTGAPLDHCLYWPPQPAPDSA